MIAAALVVVMLVGITYAFAQGPGFGPGPRMKGKPCWESGGPGNPPNLTPEQKTKFQELRRKFNEETAQHKGALLTKRLELQSLWTNPKAEAKAILDKEKELRDLQNQMRDKMIQYKLEARKFLTPEQITEFGEGCGMGSGPGRGRMMGFGRGMGPHGAGFGTPQ